MFKIFASSLMAAVALGEGNPTEAEAKGVFEAFDSDKSNGLSYDEFD